MEPSGHGGGNILGQLGDGTTTNRGTPVQTSDLTGVKDIAVEQSAPADMFVYALKEDGTVWAWGYNSTLGTEEPSSTLILQKPTLVVGLTGITKISIEAFHRLALKNDGTVWAWRANIGNGTTEGKRNPVQVVGLTDIIDIKTVFYSSYALKKDGTVWAWGIGLLKDETTVEHLTPTQMCSLAGITDIVIPRLSFSPYLLRNDGTVWRAYFDGCTQL